LLGCMSRFLRPSTTALVFRVVMLGLAIIHRYPQTSSYSVYDMLLIVDGAREDIRASVRTRLKFEGCHRPNCPVVALLCCAPLLRCGHTVATCSA
jgi:hypothetical protein